MAEQVEILKDGLQKMIFNNSKVRSTLGEIIIITTEDKIQLCLLKHLGDLEEKRGWITPFSLLITIIVTFLTTDFKDWWFKKETWEAVFLLAGVFFLMWLLWATKKAWPIKTVKDVLEEIKESSIKYDHDEKNA